MLLQLNNQLKRILLLFTAPQIYPSPQSAIFLNHHSKNHSLSPHPKSTQSPPPPPHRSTPAIQQIKASRPPPLHTSRRPDSLSSRSHAPLSASSLPPALLPLHRRLRKASPPSSAPRQTSAHVFQPSAAGPLRGSADPAISQRLLCHQSLFVHLTAAAISSLGAPSGQIRSFPPPAAPRRHQRKASRCMSSRHRSGHPPAISSSPLRHLSSGAAATDPSSRRQFFPNHTAHRPLLLTAVVPAPSSSPAD